jgi:hypothetical protein
VDHSDIFIQKERCFLFRYELKPNFGSIIYLFISLFNDAFSFKDYIASSQRLIVKFNREGMQKEVVVTCLKVIFQHLAGRTKE